MKGGGRSNKKIGCSSSSINGKTSSCGAVTNSRRGVDQDTHGGGSRSEVTIDYVPVFEGGGEVVGTCNSCNHCSTSSGLKEVP